MLGKLGKRQRTSFFIEKRKKYTDDFFVAFRKHVQSVLDDDAVTMHQLQKNQGKAMHFMLKNDINLLFVSPSTMTTVEFCNAFIHSAGVLHLNNVYQSHENSVIARGMDGEFSVYDVPKNRCRIRILDRKLPASTQTSLANALLSPKDNHFQKVRFYTSLSLKMAACKVVAPIVLMAIVPEFISDEINVDVARSIVNRNRWANRQDADWKRSLENPIEEKYNLDRMNIRYYEKDNILGRNTRKQLLPEHQVQVINRKLGAGFLYVTCLSTNMWRNVRSMILDSPNSSTITALGDHIVALFSSMIANDVPLLGFTLDKILVHFNAKTGRPIRCFLEHAPFIGGEDIIKVPNDKSKSYIKTLKKHHYSDENPPGLRASEVTLMCMIFYASTLFQILRLSNDSLSDPLVQKIYSMCAGSPETCVALLQIGMESKPMRNYLNIVHRVWQMHRMEDRRGKAVYAQREPTYAYGSMDDLVNVILDQIDEHVDGHL